MIKICETCKTEFTTNRTRSKYCTKECQWAGLQKQETRNCLKCGKTFSCQQARTQKFCSKSCASSGRKILRTDDKLTKTCKYPACQTKITKNYIYCEAHRKTHNRIYTWDYFFRWKHGLIVSPTTLILPDKLRLMLIEEAGFSCSECGFSEPHPIDGSSILEIDHVNGNGADHTYNNLRVLCPNHHTMTETYRSRNIGNGSKGYYYSKILTKHK